MKLGVLSRVPSRLKLVGLVAALAAAAVVLLFVVGPFGGSSQPAPSAEPLWRASAELERVYVERGAMTARDLVEGALLAMSIASAEAEAGDGSETESREMLSERIREVTDEVPDEVPSEFEDVWRAWRSLTDAGLDPETLLVDTLRGMVRATGDPGAQVLVGVSATDGDDYVAEDYEGIGSLVDPTADELIITVPFPGGPAAKAGLRSGDVVKAVDGRSVEGLDVQEVIARVRGPAGTEVQLTVERPGLGELDVTVLREALEVATVSSRPLHGNIAYLSISRFDSGTPDELAQELEFLLDQRVEGLVVDLRDNPGGSRSVGLAVADEFLDGGVVYREETLEGTTITHEAQPGGLGVDLSLAVVVDRRTAGVAEIVAAALRHHQRGALIGEATAGQALLYSPNEVGQGIVVLLPSGRWLTPEGGSVFQRGLGPDGVVNVTPDDLVIGVDPQIQAGFGFLWTLLEEQASAS